MPPDKRTGPQVTTPEARPNVAAACSAPDPLRVTERWFGATLYSVSRGTPRDPSRGLPEALDHLDSVGLCVCWVGPRKHRSAA